MRFLTKNQLGVECGKVLVLVVGGLVDEYGYVSILVYWGTEKSVAYVVPTSYQPQFSSERDQIWTQHVFLKCLEVLFLEFFKF